MLQRRDNRPKLDGRLKVAKRVKSHAQKYMQALGYDMEGDTPEHIVRVAELMALAEVCRARALRGEVEVDLVTRIERLADRALRQLGLPEEAPEIEPDYPDPPGAAREWVAAETAAAMARASK
jgi:hypothetical protein